MRGRIALAPRAFYAPGERRGLRPYRIGGVLRLSIISSRALGLFGFTLAAILPLPALAQNVESATDRRVQDWVTGQKRQTDLRDKRCYLPARPGDDIVVCGEVDPDRDRLPLRGELESARSTNDGLPRAPRFDRGSCKGQPGCIGFGKVPDPIYYVDVKDLPEAPAGSDANLIATGEKAEP